MPSYETLPSGSPGVNAAGEWDTMEDARSKIRLCSAADVAPGTAVRVETHGLTLAVFNLDGAFYVTDDHCTHGPGSLSEGFIEGDVVECNFHGGQFNIKTGGVFWAPWQGSIKNQSPPVPDGQ